MWVSKWLSEDRRPQLGHYSTFLTRELRHEDVNAFQNYLRIPPEVKLAAQFSSVTGFMFPRFRFLEFPQLRTHTFVPSL